MNTTKEYAQAFREAREILRNLKAHLEARLDDKQGMPYEDFKELRDLSYQIELKGNELSEVISKIGDLDDE